MFGRGLDGMSFLTTVLVKHAQKVIWTFVFFEAVERYVRGLQDQLQVW